jgi:hypothetical protein
MPIIATGVRQRSEWQGCLFYASVDHELLFRWKVWSLRNLTMFFYKWLMLYAKSREVAGSRPDEVNDFFQFT